jgi:tetratricopeptide (TPR) repeat protein
MVIAPVALAGLALLSFRQVSYWESTEQLFEHALSVTQGNWAIHRALASHLDSRGDRAGAVEHYVAALAINPSDYQAHGNLAGVHARQGRFDLAIAHYEQSLELGTVHLLAEGADSEQRRAQLAAVHFDLALALAQVGRKPEARRHRSEAIRFDARYEGRPIPGLTN